MSTLFRSAARLTAAAFTGSLLLTGCGSGEAEPAADAPAEGWRFTSRPDLTPPRLSVDRKGPARPDDGTVVLLGPKGDDVAYTGPLIVDDDGEPVWVHPTEGPAFDVRVQEYAGRPVLTWWRGEMGTGLGFGEVVVVDDSYAEIGRVTTGGTVGPGQADIHETRLTDAGTMLLAAYARVPADLSPVGGPADGWLWDNVVQEVDVATGEVLLEWRALDHVPLEETMAEFDAEDADGSRDEPFDYFHVNSVAEDADGDLLVSARNTCAVYRLDRTTGEVRWTLGGEASDFTMGPGTPFYWQHDAERQADGTLTLFDNQSEPDMAERSRGLRLALDETARTATLVTEYLPPEADRLAGSQGSFQQLPDGTVLIGWGSRPYYSEFTADGTLRTDVHLGPGHSYRAERAAWVGRPAAPPDAVRTGTTVRVSWNGATEVAAWRLVAGGVPGDPVAREGFETTLPVRPGGGALRVEALDDDGQVIGAAAVR